MILLLILVTALSFATANQCGDTPCVDYCIQNPTTSGLEDEYIKIYQLIQSIRGARLTYFADGMAFLMDATITSDQETTDWVLQKDLASILALAVPTELHCNPSYVSRYFHWGS